ncbi:MAG: hypothetical protein ACI9YT_002062 [Halobacteriales archaeon]
MDTVTENATPSAGAKRVRLSRPEVWVVDNVTTDRLIEAEEHSEPSPRWTTSVTRTIEDDRRTFTTFEAWRLRQALVDDANDDETPPSDASIAGTVADRRQSTFGSPPSTLRQDDDERFAERR